MNFMLLRASYDDIWNFNPLNPIDLKSSAIKQLKKSYERFLYISFKYLSNKQHHFTHPTYAVKILIRIFISIISINLD
jgi:hypothetical protein